MTIQSVALRSALLIGTLLIAGAAYVAWEIQREVLEKDSQAEEFWDDACKRALRTEKFIALSYLFRQEGERVSFSEWPQTLGDVPGYYEGAELFILNVNRQDLVFKKPPPSTKVEWTLWQFPGKYRWFAVATVRYHVGPPPPVEPLVVMRKHGLNEKLPTKK